MNADLPTSESARSRLRAAQKAEATALRDVEMADRAQQRAQQKLSEAETSLQTARLELVLVSGLDRAALLLDLPVEQLRPSSKVQRQRHVPLPGVADGRDGESRKVAAP